MSSKWNRETAIRTMVCVICGNNILARERPAVKRFRARPITLCKECEEALKERIEVDEDPMFKVLGGYHRKRR